MKKTKQQIAFALKQAETGTRVAEVCRKMGISEATFYNWKKKYGGLGVSELRRLNQLEDENQRLKRMVADLSLDVELSENDSKAKGVVKYCTMQIDDYADALVLWQGAESVQLRAADSLEGVARYLAHNPGLSFIAESGGKMVGTIMAGHDGRRGYIRHLAVQTECRNAGIGRELLRRCLVALTQVGISKSHVHVLSVNNIAREFWRARGWQLRDDIAVYSFVNDGDDNA